MQSLRIVALLAALAGALAACTAHDGSTMPYVSASTRHTMDNGGGIPGGKSASTPAPASSATPT